MSASRGTERPLSLLKFVTGLALGSLLGVALSYLAVHAFWFGARLFQSVPAARVCDGVGKVFLLPARLLLYVMGGSNQSTPMMNPQLFMVVNGVLLGMAGYLLFRRWRRKG